MTVLTKNYLLTYLPPTRTCIFRFLNAHTRTYTNRDSCTQALAHTHSPTLSHAYIQNTHTHSLSLTLTLSHTCRVTPSQIPDPSLQTILVQIRRAAAATAAPGLGRTVLPRPEISVLTVNSESNECGAFVEGHVLSFVIKILISLLVSEV